MGILEAIKKAFQMMPGLASNVGALAVTVIVLGLVIGVFTYESVTTGNINIDNTSSNMIAGQSGNFSTVVDVLWNAVTSVTGFIIIGVIAIIAIAILGKKLFKGTNP